MKNIANILFKIFRCTLCLVCVLFLIYSIFYATNEFLHYDDNVFDDKEKISYIVDSYQNNGTLDLIDGEYTIKCKDSKIEITNKTCCAIISLDEKRNATDVNYKLIKTANAAYFCTIILYFFSLSFFMNRFKDHVDYFIKKSINSKKKKELIL